jgi:hypothetical protein
MFNFLGMSGNFCFAYFLKFVWRQEKAFVCDVTQQKVGEINARKGDIHIGSSLKTYAGLFLPHNQDST